MANNAAAKIAPENTVNITLPKVTFAEKTFNIGKISPKTEVINPTNPEAA